MIYFTHVKTLLTEFSEIYLVSNKNDLFGKTISFIEGKLMFFTDGTYAFILLDDDDGLCLCEPGNIQYNIYWYDRYNKPDDEFWVPFKKFLKQYHPDYLDKFEEVNEYDKQEYQDVLKRNSFNSAIKELEQLQKKYPNLNITFKNEQN